MKFFTFISTLLFPLLVNSQTFSTIIKNGKTNIPINMIEMGGYYFLANNTTPNQEFINEGYIYKLNKQGKVLDSLIFNDGKDNEIFRLINRNDSLVCIDLKTDHTDSVSINYRVFDENFNELLVNSVKSSIPPSESYFANSIINGKGNVTLVFSYFGVENEIDVSGITFYDFSNTGFPIQTKTIKTSSSHWRVTIQNNYHNNGYLLFFRSFTITTDLSFNRKDTIVANFDFDDTYLLLAEGVWKNDELFVSAPYDAEDNLYYPGICKTDTNLTFLKGARFGYTDLYEYYLPYQSIDTTNGGFFTAATTDLNPYIPGFEDDSNGLRVIKVDDDLNAVWDKRYLNDAYYYFTCLKSTSDGGCILAGRHYDFEQPEKIFHLKIIKLDSLGNYLPDNVTEHPWKPLAANVYPNPVTYVSTLSFNNLQNNAFHLAVYGVTGQVVLARKVTGEQVELKRGNFTRGCYLYRLLGEQGEVLTGKFVVE